MCVCVCVRVCAGAVDYVSETCFNLTTALKGSNLTIAPLNCFICFLASAELNETETILAPCVEAGQTRNKK